MSKNLMPEIAKMLDMEYGERFNVQGLDGGEDRLKAYLDETGLHFVDFIVCNDAEYKYLAKMLTGELEYEKLPWEPRNGDIFFYPCPYMKQVLAENWNYHTMGYALLALGMVYRTQAEAEKHLAADYEKLTGEPLEV